jgi:glyoxylase-like metal-dependent hydrolase (beta-lactamase superfamily II)
VQDRPVPETVAFWRAAGMDEGRLAKRSAERPFNFADVVAPLPLGYRRVADGDRVHMGGRDWQVRTGEGHAPEHATFWSLSDNLVLGGDQLLASISPNLGVYATEPDADPVGDWIAATRAFQAHARADHLVLPGHKLPFTGLPFRLEQIICSSRKGRPVNGSLCGFSGTSTGHARRPSASRHFSGEPPARRNTGSPLLKPWPISIIF